MLINRIICLSLFTGLVSLFSFVSALENSIIPMIEKYELLENHPISKYSSSQYSEIANSLNRKDERIRIATYNVLFDLYDHNLDACYRWPQRLPRIVELIDEMQPDILGVQELYFRQFNDLMPYLDEKYAFYTKPCEDGEQNGIFYNKERFEIVDSKVWYMTSTPHIPSSETLTMLQLKDRKTDKVFAVFNAHLAFSNIEKRDFQARFINQQVESMAEKIPVVVMGDLNTFPHRLDLDKLPFYDGDYVHRILTKGRLKDAREVAVIGHLGPISTFSNGSDNGIPFKGIGTPGVFLDHIYVSSKVTVLAHAVQPATVDNLFPSDHFPLLIDCIAE